MMNNILEPIGIKFGKITGKSKIEDEVRFESSHIAGVSLKGMRLKRTPNRITTKSCKTTNSELKQTVNYKQSKRYKQQTFEAVSRIV